MPELPEVEAARSLADKHCKGLKIFKAVVADDEKVIEGIDPRDLETALEGKTIEAACRKGKQLWLDLGNSTPALMLHFGMTGCLVVKGIDAVKYVNAKTIDPHAWPPKYCKIELHLSRDRKLAFCDSRRFARARLQEDPLNNPPVSLLGYDILNDDFTAEELIERLAKRKSAIKSVIMDQAVLAGVGNWVADEVLHLARIHPAEKAADLTLDQTVALRSALKKVAKLACDVDADSSRFPEDWLFAHRWTPKKAPARIHFLTIGGRTTAFEPAIQKLTTPPAPDAKLEELPSASNEMAKKSKTSTVARRAPATKASTDTKAVAGTSKEPIGGSKRIGGRTSTKRTRPAAGAHTEQADDTPAAETGPVSKKTAGRREDSQLDA